MPEEFRSKKGKWSLPRFLTFRLGFAPQADRKEREPAEGLARLIKRKDVLTLVNAMTPGGKVN